MNNFKYDASASEKAAQDPKMKAYVEWSKKNGAIFDKVEFPAVFDGVMGARAKEDILPNEAYLFVPN